jgi:DNA (cytosine-5)-methyltransferase 1
VRGGGFFWLQCLICLMPAYYNEIDPYAAQWLRNLIDAGHIAPGVVDERSIEDVRPVELVPYDQCHFFAGVGVWSLALRAAGWRDDWPVWTGSCPCQPFSATGKGAGFADERHLWPAFYHLIAQHRPKYILGEQVASGAAGSWFDLVQADLEALGYAFGCVAFPSASVGAPHIRDRAYWLADASGRGRDFRASPAERQTWAMPRSSSGYSPVWLDNTDNTRPQGHTGDVSTAQRPGPSGSIATAGVPGGQQPGPVNGRWRDADWLQCRDGKWRPVEPGTFPLAHGIAGRVGRLRAYGNALNAEQAQAFIEAAFF